MPARTLHVRVHRSLDKRKRPALFLNLAREFPQYRFIAAGESTSLGESGYDLQLRRRYEGLPNLEMPGIVNQFEAASAIFSAPRRGCWSTRRPAKLCH
jgi:hypothetical protein